MPLFSADPDKCKRDHICVDECPARIIEIREESPVPTLVDGAAEFCINCGHCVAVCPHGALTLKTMGPDDCLPVNPRWRLDPDRVEYFLRSRRSIRTYKPEPVERDTLTRLIAVARHAPSGHNLQPVRWTVIHNTDTVRALAGHVVDWMRFLIKEHPAMAEAMHLERAVSRWEGGEDVVCRSAPHLTIVHADKEDRTAPAASTIALTYLELAAPSFDLGGCWAGYFGAAATVWPPLQEALALPDGHICFGAMMIGTPKYKYHRMPPRNPLFVEWR
jgi:nitroreductase/NAD-dependent dihydropyrimidine dehydrogenase PreA subunit